jgi:hypothetical protein
VVANPKPQETVRSFDRKGAIVQREAGWPNLLPVALANLLELQWRMLRIGFQKQKLFVGPLADLLRERPVSLPEVCTSAMLHPSLKRLETIVFFIAQGSLDGVVETARRKIGLDAGIERVLLVEPHIQFFQLLRRQGADGAFDFLDRV